MRIGVWKGGKDGGREGRREGWREGSREGGRDGCSVEKRGKEEGSVDRRVGV